MKKMINAFLAESFTGKMVSIFLLSLMLLAMTCKASAQVTRQGNTFKQEQTSSSRSSQAIETKYTWETKDGKTYKIMLSKNGRAYIVRTSAKTGNEYKQYLDEQTSRTICSEMGVTYVEKASK